MKTSLPLASIYEASHLLQRYLSPTPLRFSRALSEQFQSEVWLKLECYQPTGSFKVRGALYKLARLVASGTVVGVVTGSAGNHGLGVAYASQSLGIETGAIVVPRTAPDSKIQKLRQFPLELTVEGGTYEEAAAFARELGAARGWSYIPAYDDVDIITGQGTVGLEVMQELPGTDVIVVPVGGGGLIAGIANAVKQINPLCEVIGVQAAASPAAVLSLQDGQPYDPYEHQPTIADGLAGGFGKIPYYLARMLIDRIELAQESQFQDAVRHLLEIESLIAEPSGAISTHPLVKADSTWTDRRVVCVVSGGNLDLALLKKILNTP